MLSSLFNHLCVLTAYALLCSSDWTNSLLLDAVFACCVSEAIDDPYHELDTIWIAKHLALLHTRPL